MIDEPLVRYGTCNEKRRVITWLFGWWYAHGRRVVCTSDVDKDADILLYSAFSVLQYSVLGAPL